MSEFMLGANSVEHSSRHAQRCWTAKLIKSILKGKQIGNEMSSVRVIKTKFQTCIKCNKLLHCNNNYFWRTQPKVWVFFDLTCLSRPSSILRHVPQTSSGGSGQSAPSGRPSSWCTEWWICVWGAPWLLASVEPEETGGQFGEDINRLTRQKGFRVHQVQCHRSHSWFRVKLNFRD